MSIIEVEHLAKTFKTREREAGLTGSLRSFIAPRYREREAVKSINFSLAKCWPSSVPMEPVKALRSKC